MTSDTAQNGVLRTGILDLQQPECLHFFYVMNGPPGVRRLANLNVILSMGTADDHMEKSWKEIMGNFGREWQEVTVDLPVGKYFLAIEAYIIDYRHDRLIAIDDVTISNCSDSALRNVSVDILDQCDFENRYMCKYSDSVTDLHVWDRIRPGYRRLPATDHTGPDILGNGAPLIIFEYIRNSEYFVEHCDCEVVMFADWMSLYRKATNSLYPRQMTWAPLWGWGCMGGMSPTFEGCLKRSKAPV